MPGVHGLQAYISKTAAARTRLDLKRVGSPKPRSKSRLLCDLSPVIEWLLSAHDARLVETGQLSPYALLYGGDLKLYGERVVSFVRALKHVGVTPVFFVEGSPGADTEKFETHYSELRRQHDRLLERCGCVYQVCEGSGDMLQVHWQLAGCAISEVAASLQAEGVSLEYCPRGTVVEMIEYQRRHSSVMGVLSNNTDFAVAVGSKLFPIALFDLDDDLGIGSASICQRPAQVACEWVDPSTLSRSLQLYDERNLIDISIVCGNRFTASLNRTLEPCKRLGISGSSFEHVARWVAELEPDQWPPVAEKLDSDPVYCDAIARSFELYDHGKEGREGDSPPSAIRSGVNGVVLKVRVKLCDPVVVSIGNGVYWRWPVLEPVSLGQPCFTDLTLPLRKKAYSLLGEGEVFEYGRTSTKSFASVPVVGESSGSGVALSDWSELQRLVALFRLITDPDLDGSSIFLNGEGASELEGVSLQQLAALPRVVLVCASLCFMLRLASQPGYHLEPEELQALLMTCLFCSAGISPVVLPERPSSRALSLGMQFSHTLDQVQLLASTLGLRDVLPPPSSLFFPMAFIPQYMASSVNQQPSSNLKEAYHNYLWALHKPPTAHLVDELSNNWRKPNLKNMFDLFLETVECIRGQRSVLFQGSPLPCLPPPHLRLNFTPASREDEEDDQWEREASQSEDSDPSEEVMEGREGLAVTPKSDHGWGEVPSSRDRLTLEEDFQYFSREMGGLVEREIVGGEGELVVEEEEGEGGRVEVEGEEGCEEVGVVVGGDDKEKETEVGDVECVNEDDVEMFSCADSMAQDEVESVSLHNSESASGHHHHESGGSMKDEEDATHQAPTPSPPPTPSSSCSYSYSSTDPEPTPPPSSHLLELPRRYAVDLPIAVHRRKLLELIEENRVVCMEGETGCGKSTRVPQYILDHSLSSSPRRSCRVLVTQPRRMAAIKLAERVASERGEQVGFTVGYSVGGDHSNTSEAAITYCTTGYLLQALVHNPDTVGRYTHIILDEIHERSTDADFTLLVIRELLGVPGCEAKLIIMSATMQGSLVVDYLQQHFTSVAGPYFVGVKHYDVETFFIDELLKIPQSEVFWDPCQLTAAANLRDLAEDRPRENLSTAFTTRPMVSSFTQKVCTELLISKANLGESVLIFLPGYQEIVHYYEYLQCEIGRHGIDTRFRIFILHSQIPFEDQREAFLDPPSSVAHVILATNIAESSITLPKLRLVINFGIYRRLQYDSRRHISCLVRSWCSRASCEQRAGRAGRVFEGTVVHLFTRRFHDVVLPAYDPPEILTAPIAKLVLQAKQIGRNIGHPRPSSFLSRAIEPPSLQQLEAALQDLARLGAIECRPGEVVDEEADITFLGRFSLSLPVDLDLSRVVLFGALFGCAADAVVIAASMSLSQEVLSLPTRVVMKNEKEFQQSLGRSLRNRYSLDSGSYSDAILVRNLFKKWLELRSENTRVSKHGLARRFSAGNACQWERLLQLESVTSEIAQKTLHHIPPGTIAHRELKKLVSLHGLRSIATNRSSRRPATERESFDVAFCEDEDVLRAVLAAAYPHQLIFGIRECESLNGKERAASLAELKLIESSGADIARTLVMTCEKKVGTAAVQQLVEAVLPQNFCQVNSFGATSLVTLNHTFESNPLTSLLHGHSLEPPATGRDRAADDKLVSSSLPPEMVLLWQFGERRPKWTAGDVEVSFSRPRHPLAVSWFRVTREKERVHVLSWRNPTGLVCEVDTSRQATFFLAVAGHLQGFGSSSYVSASHLTLLPSLHSGRNSLLLALAFQPLTAKVNALTDTVHHRVIGLDVNTFTMSPLPLTHHLDPLDMYNVNQLRKLISEVFSSHFTSNQLSVSFLSKVPCLLSRLLSHGRSPQISLPPETTATTSEVRWERLITSERREDVVSDDESDIDEEEECGVGGQEEVETVERVYQYLPPFQSTTLEHLPEKAAADLEEESDQALSAGESGRVVAGTSDNTESELRNGFQLSPNAPEFVPALLEASSSTLLPSDSDDHDHSSVEQQAVEPTRPLLPLPTLPLSNLPLSDVFDPHFLNSISLMSSAAQQSVLSAVDELLVKCSTVRSRLVDSVSTDQPTAPEQHSLHAVCEDPEQQMVRSRHHVPLSPVGSGVPVTGSPLIPTPFLSHPPSPTRPYLPALPRAHPSTSQHHQGTVPHVRRANIPTPPKSPALQRSTLLCQEYLSGVRVPSTAPQFPHPYTALQPQPQSVPLSLHGAWSTAVTSPPPTWSTAALPPGSFSPTHVSLRPINTELIPSSHLRSRQQLLAGEMTASVQYPRFFRKPLSSSFHSKLDLSSRAPGARLDTVGGRYQARFPSQPLPPPLSMRPPPGFTQSMRLLSPAASLPHGYPPKKVQGSSERFHSSVHPHSPPSLHRSLSMPPTPTSSLPPVVAMMQELPQFQAMCRDMGDFVDDYLQGHGGFEGAKTLLKKYLEARRLSDELFGPLWYELCGVCRRRFKLFLSDNEVIVSLKMTPPPPPPTLSDREPKPSSERDGERFMEEGRAGETVKPPTVPGRDVREKDDVEQSKAELDAVSAEKEGGSVGDSSSIVSPLPTPDYTKCSASPESELASRAQPTSSVDLMGSQSAVECVEQLSGTAAEVELGIVVTASGDQSTVERGEYELSVEETSSQSTSDMDLTLIAEEPIITEPVTRDEPRVQSSCQPSSTEDVNMTLLALATEWAVSDTMIEQAKAEESSEEEVEPLREEEMVKRKEAVVEESVGKEEEAVVEESVGKKEEAVMEDEVEEGQEKEGATVQNGRAISPSGSVHSERHGATDNTGELPIHSTPLTTGVLPDHSTPLTTGVLPGHSTPLTTGELPGHSTPLTTGELPGHSTPLTTGVLPSHSTPLTTGELPSHSTPLTTGVLPSHSTPLTTGELPKRAETCFDESEVESEASSVSVLSRDSHLTPLKSFDSHDVGFFVACLKVVGGHSHLSKLGPCYRAVHGTSLLITMRTFCYHPDIFRVSKSVCVILRKGLDLEMAGVPHVELDASTKTALKNCRDNCPTFGRNIGGSKIGSVVWQELIASSPSSTRSSRKRKKSVEKDRRWRSHTPTLSDQRSSYDKRSSWRCKTRFPKDVEVETDPGHISHILKFYGEFFASRSSPILYSDLLRDYVSSADLPGDFYLPSDLLKDHFHVYREDQKRYIRPLEKTEAEEASPSPQVSGSAPVERQQSEKDAQVKRQSKNDAPVKKDAPAERQREKDAPVERQREKDEAKSASVKKKTKSVSETKSAGSVLDSKRGEKEVKSRCVPGDTPHVLEYFRTHTSKSPEPVLFSHLLKEYTKEFELPSSYHIKLSPFKSEFNLFLAHGVRYITSGETQGHTARTAAGQTTRGEGTAPVTREASAKVEKKTGLWKQSCDVDSSDKTTRPPSGAKPGSPDHILKFYHDLFDRLQEPLPLWGFSTRYLKFYSAPTGFRISKYFFHRHFTVVRYSGKRYVTPVLWSRQAAPVAPVVSDECPMTTEVWEVDDVIANESVSSTTTVCENTTLPEGGVENLSLGGELLEAAPQSMGADSNIIDWESGSRQQGADDVAPQGEMEVTPQSQEVDEMPHQGDLEAAPQSVGADGNTEWESAPQSDDVLPQGALES